MTDMTRRRLLGALPLAVAGAAAAKPAPLPFASLIELDGRACELLVWTPEAWAALPAADRPAEASPMSGGAWRLCRRIDQTDDLARYSPDPRAAAAFELASARAEADRLRLLRAKAIATGDRGYVVFVDRALWRDARARLARAEARVRSLA